MADVSNTSTTSQPFSSTDDLVKVQDLHIAPLSTLNARPGLGTTASSDVLFEIKNGKVVSRQKAVLYGKLSETMQEIVNFRQFLRDRVSSNDGPLPSIPIQQMPMIAKLVHESDKTASILAKQIRQEVLPVEPDPSSTTMSTPMTESLSVTIIDAAIKGLADRVNYGLDAFDGLRPPVSLCVWRWEVKAEYYDAFPVGVREGLAQRREEREKAQAHLRAAFDALSTEEKTRLYKGSKPIEKDVAVDENTEQSEHGKRPGRPKKSTDLDKAAKEKEKQEKKAAKAEKEKKALDAQKKSRSMMANFFGTKINSTSAGPSPSRSSNHALEDRGSKHAKNASVTSIGSIPAATGTGNLQSEFERTFKPFVVKKDAELAPLNRFRNASGEAEAESRVIQDHGHWNAQDVLRSSLKSMLRMKRSSQYPRRRNIGFSVRDVITQLSEAEITGDTAAVIAHLATLASRDALPAKVFIFHTDTRPGYFGTFTKTSRLITARHPLQRDAVAFDYNYDSSEDWEEEEGGDDVMEPDEAGSAEEEESALGSDLDDWLVDDDDVEEPMPEDVDIIELRPPPPFPAAKRKAVADGKERIEKKRRVVVPLVPFVKGPHWDPEVTGSGYAPFKPYCLKLFNDSVLPLDPFTFVSQPPPSGSRHSGHISLSSEPPPSLAPKSVSPSMQINALENNTILPPPQPTAKPRKSAAASAPAPKTPFPTIHLPLLFSKIESLNTGSIVLIVESVYQDLKVHKVKKNSIEAKVREVGEKDRWTKVWVLKPEFSSKAGQGPSDTLTMDVTT